MRRYALLLTALACGCGAKSGLGEPAPDFDAGVGGSGGFGGTGGLGGTGGVGGSGGGCIPVTETCNGLDDDCDGVIDDGSACFFLNGTPIDPVPATSCGASWYSYDFPDAQSANPSPDIRRSEKVVLAVQYAPTCGAYLAVIADLPQDGSGGGLDGAFTITPSATGQIVEVSDEPNECTVFGGGMVTCNWTWQPCCTDGVLLGPFSSNACVNIRLKNGIGVSGLVALDGADGEIELALPATVDLCMTLTPPS